MYRNKSPVSSSLPHLPVTIFILSSVDFTDLSERVSTVSQDPQIDTGLRSGALTPAILMRWNPGDRYRIHATTRTGSTPPTATSVTASEVHLLSRRIRATAITHHNRKLIDRGGQTQYRTLDSRYRQRGWPSIRPRATCPTTRVTTRNMYSTDRSRAQLLTDVMAACHATQTNGSVPEQTLTICQNLFPFNMQQPRLNTRQGQHLHSPTTITIRKR